MSLSSTFLVTPLRSQAQILGVLPNPDLKKAGQYLADFGKEVVSEMAKYPTQKAGVRYRRTGTYGRGWTVGAARRSGGALVVVIGNNTAYSQYLGGPNQVWWANAYGWQNITVVRSKLWDSKYKARVKSALTGLPR